MNSKANKNKIFESSSRGKGKWLISMSILIGSLIGGAIAVAVVSFIVDFIDKCL